MLFGTAITLLWLAQNTSLQPFFDQVNNPASVSFPSGQQADITPPPPQLNPFDEAVLKICSPMEMYGY